MSLLSNVLGQYDAPQKAKDMGVIHIFALLNRTRIRLYKSLESLC